MILTGGQPKLRQKTSRSTRPRLPDYRFFVGTYTSWWFFEKKTLVQLSRRERCDPMQRCVGKLLLIATCSRRMSMVSLACIANCDTSVVFVLQMQCEPAIRSKDRTCVSYGLQPDRSKMAPTGAPDLEGQWVRTGYVVARGVRLCRFVTSLERCVTKVDLSIYSKVKCCIYVYR